MAIQFPLYEALKVYIAGDDKERQQNLTPLELVSNLILNQRVEVVDKSLRCRTRTSSILAHGFGPSCMSVEVHGDAQIKTTKVFLDRV